MDAIVGPAEYRVCLLDGVHDLGQLFGDRPEGNGNYVRSQDYFVLANGYGGDLHYSIESTSGHPVYLTGSAGLPADGVLTGADRAYHVASLTGNATLPGNWTETADPSDYSLKSNCIVVGAYHNKANWQVASVTVELPTDRKGAYQDVNFVLTASNGAQLARNMRIVALYGPGGSDEVVLYAFSAEVGGSGPIMTAPAPVGFLDLYAMTQVYSGPTGTTGLVRAGDSWIFEFDGALALDPAKELWGFRFDDVNPALNWAARGLAVFAATATRTVAGNVVPTADAGTDQIILDSDEDGVEVVQLDGTASIDPDGVIVSHVWSEGGAQIARGLASTVLMAVGSHTVTLTIADGAGAVGTDTVLIEVNSPPAGSPIADAGGDRTVFDGDDSGDEEVMLDGSASSDPDGTIVSWVWTEGAVEVATGEMATVVLAVGVHDITLTVTDNDGRPRTDTATVAVAPYRPPVTYYVDASVGDDANPGTDAASWATVQHAADAIATGDTVVVRPGQYDELVTVRQSGAEGHLVVFRAEPSRQAVVKGFVLAADYVRVEGFEITNPAAGANGIHAGEAHRGTARNGCEMIDNYIHDVDGRCILTGENAVARGNLMWNVGNGFLVNSGTLVEGNEIDGLTVVMDAPDDARNAKYAFWAGDDITFRGNYFHGTSMEHMATMSCDFFATWDSWIWGPSHNILIENNIGFNATHASEPTAELLQESSHITYRNNLFANTAYVGILCKGWSDITVVNNTLINCGAYPIWFQTKRETEGSTARNNLIAYWNHMPPPGGKVAESGVANYALYSDPTATVDCDYNLFWGCTNRGYGANDFTAEPIFVDPANRDFRQGAGSPGVDAGSPLSAPAYDIVGAPRPMGAGFDVGAYEFADAHPGDADGDGDVDLLDFVRLKQNFGTPTGATFAQGDFDGDGDVDLQDFVILKQNFGSGPANCTGLSSADL